MINSGRPRVVKGLIGAKTMNQRGKSRKQRGFTLVELLLVLVILALIAGLVLPGIIGKAEGAKARAASSQISRISMAVETFYLDTGSTPGSLSELVDEPGDVRGWNGPYIKSSILKDPWGKDYQFRNPGQHGDFDIYSYGADGQQGGEGKNADITSWE
jgi:general secretion pathway protein G